MMYIYLSTLNYVSSSQFSDSATDKIQNTGIKNKTYRSKQDKETDITNLYEKQPWCSRQGKE